MLRYKFLYLWFRLCGNSACMARGKIARWITRNVRTSIEDTLKEIWRNDNE